jgi:hypothetical protein
MKYETRITEWTIVPEGDPIFSERATRISIVDDGGGEFVEVEQEEVGKIQIDPTEWPVLRAAIDKAVEQCRDDGERQHAENDG